MRQRMMTGLALMGVTYLGAGVVVQSAVIEVQAAHRIELEAELLAADGELLRMVGLEVSDPRVAQAVLDVAAKGWRNRLRQIEMARAMADERRGR